MIDPSVSSGELLSALRDRLQGLEEKNVEERALLEREPVVPDMYRQLQWLLDAARMLLVGPSPKAWDALREYVEDFGALEIVDEYDHDGVLIEGAPREEIIELGKEASITARRFGELQRLYKVRLEVCRDEMAKLKASHKEYVQGFCAESRKFSDDHEMEIQKLLADQVVELERVRSEHQKHVALVEKDAEAWRASLGSQIDRQRAEHLMVLNDVQAEVKALRLEHVKLKEERDWLSARCDDLKDQVMDQPMPSESMRRDPRD